MNAKLDRFLFASINRLHLLGSVWYARHVEQQRQLQANAVFGYQAVLGPEGVVENYTGDKHRVTIGAHSYIRGRLMTYGHGGAIAIGQWCYVGARTEIWSMESITIGDRVLVSHDVNIHDGTAHSINAGERHQHFQDILTTGHPRSSEELPGVFGAPIVIEDDVWISFGVSILRGVRIGAGSVIAAGALVTKDVPSGVLYRCESIPIISPLPIAGAVTAQYTAGH